MGRQASVRTRLATALAPARQWWNRLDARQQRLVGGGAALLAAALLFAYVWLPAVRERERLTARLPRLAAQLLQMQAQAAEIRQLNSSSPIAPAPPVPADTAVLQSAFGEGTSVSSDSGRAFRVVIPRIGYASWWDRLGDVQSRHQLQLVSLSLRALPGDARQVSVEMRLADLARTVAPPASGAAK